MTDSTLVAVIAAIPPTLMALAAFVTSKQNGKKADQIHVLVNSNLTNVKQELSEAKEQIIALQSLVESFLPPHDPEIP